MESVRKNYFPINRMISGIQRKHTAGRQVSGVPEGSLCKHQREGALRGRSAAAGSGVVRRIMGTKKTARLKI